jgi:hypothetical protein
VTRLLLPLLLLALAAPPRPAGASQVDLYAPSVPSLGFAGGGGALADGTAPVLHGGAAMGLLPGDLFRVHWMLGRIQLDEVQGVRRIDGRDVRVPQEAIQPHSLTLELAKAFGPWLRAGAWVNLSFPFIYFHESKDPWVPTVLRWQNRVARSIGSGALSLRLPVRGIPGRGGVSEASALQGGLWAGFGVALQPRGIIEIDMDLVGLEESEDQPDRIDVILRDVDLVAKYLFRPQASVLLDFGTFHGRLSGLRLGFSWRGETRFDVSPIHLDVEVTGLDNLNGIFSIVELIQAEVWLGLVDFYDPHQLRWSVALDRPRFAVSLDLQWNGWSRLVSSHGTVVTGDDGSSGRLLLVTQAGETRNEYEYPVVGGRWVDQAGFHDTLDLALGLELRPPGRALPALRGAEAPVRPLEPRIRLGYRYQPAIVEATSGPSALLDGATHTWGLGLGLLGPAPKAWDGPITVDWGIQIVRIGGLDLPKSSASFSGIHDPPVIYSDGARWPGGWSVLNGLSLGATF